MSNSPSTAHISEPICVLECLDNPARKRSCNNCEKQRDLDARLADARNLVLSLENERIALRSAISSRNDPITASFPLEITSHIFRSYVSLHAEENDHFDSQRGFQEISPSAPLTLGAVCRKWRMIAWSIPWLWTTLSVDLLSKGHAHGPELVDQWLTRTKGFDVDIRVHTGDDRHWMLGEHSEGNAKSTMKVINRFLSQIRCLDFEDIPFSLASRLKDLGPAATSKLQRLCVGGGPGGHEEDTESSYQVYPALFARSYGSIHESPHHPSHISLSCAVPFYQLDITWTKVTSINLYRVSRATTFYIIEASAQSLTHINLISISDDDRHDLDVGEWIPTSPIRLPWLSSLQLGEMHLHPGFTATVFDSIEAPSLELLDYQGPSHDGPGLTPINAIITFIQRSSCNIKHLVLNWPAVQDMMELICVLVQVPALQSLDLTLKPDQSIDPIFLALAHNSSVDAIGRQGTLLPELKNLKLNVHHPFNWAFLVNIWLVECPTSSNSPRARHRSIDDLPPEVVVKANPARKDLSVSLVVRGELDPSEHYISKTSLMVWMYISKDLSGSISVTADGEPRARCIVKNKEYDLLERMFLHYFAGDSEFLPLMKAMGKTPKLQ